MRKLGFALAAVTTLGLTVPASAYDGYGHGYRSWWGGPNVSIYHHRYDRPYWRGARAFAYSRPYYRSHRSWWGGY
jgi:hypothetical protein